MRGIAISTLFVLTLCGISGAQTTPDAATTAATPSDPSPGADSLKDLDALTLSCPRAALNAAAREAAKVHAQGAYQFSYFSIINESHHARYEVHFRSNYEGEPELKYCVVLYCQQGWDPAKAQPAVSLLNAQPGLATGTCPATDHTDPQSPKHAAH